MRTAVVLFTRDLRVHDQPALAAAAAAAERIVPLFVSTAPCSRASARPTAWPSCSTRCATWMPRCATRGGALVVREGDVVEETMRVAREARRRARSSSART